MTPLARGALGPGKIQHIAALAGLLESVERGLQRVDADDYRKLVSELSMQLANAPVDQLLRQILAASPATAEIYENLNYAQAGLCLQTLDVAASAEQSAAQAIRRARSNRN